MHLKIEFDDSLPEDLAILQMKKQHPIVDKIGAYFDQPYQAEVVIGYEGTSFSPIELNQIYYFFTENKAVYVKTDDNTFKIKERLYEIEAFVPSPFVRISRFEIVNLHFVKRFEYTFGGKIVLHLKNGITLYTTRTYTKDIKNILFRK